MKSFLIRIIYATVAFITILSITPTSAYAHGIGGSSGSDSTSKVQFISPTTRDFSAKSVENGQRIEIKKLTNKDLLILGIDREPFIKITNAGVFENSNSGTVIINKSTSGSINQETLISEFEKINSDSTANPKWKKISSSHTYTFHDHRIHYMGSVPDKATSLGTNSLKIEVDGKNYEVVLAFSTVDKPKSIIYIFPMILIVIVFLLMLKNSKFVEIISKRIVLLIVLVVLFIFESIHVFGYIQFVHEPIYDSLVQSLYGLILLALILAALVIFLKSGSENILYRMAPYLTIIGAFGLFIDTIGEYKFFTERYLPSTLPNVYSRSSLVTIGILSIMLLSIGLKNLSNKRSLVDN